MAAEASGGRRKSGARSTSVVDRDLRLGEDAQRVRAAPGPCRCGRGAARPRPAAPSRCEPRRSSTPSTTTLVRSTRARSHRRSATARSVASVASASTSELSSITTCSRLASRRFTSSRRTSATRTWPSDASDRSTPTARPARSATRVSVASCSPAPESSQSSKRDVDQGRAAQVRGGEPDAGQRAAHEPRVGEIGTVEVGVGEHGVEVLAAALGPIELRRFVGRLGRRRIGRRGDLRACHQPLTRRSRRRARSRPRCRRGARRDPPPSACADPPSPKTSTSRSEQPSMTAGVRWKPGATFTMPKTLTIRRTRSRSPSSARRVARIEQAVMRAAARGLLEARPSPPPCR